MTTGMIPVGVHAVTYSRDDMAVIDESRLHSEDDPHLANMVWAAGVELVRVTRASTVTDYMRWEIAEDDVAVVEQVRPASAVNPL